MVQWKTDVKLCMVYRLVPLSVTLNNALQRIQEQAIMQCRISWKWYIHLYFTKVVKIVLRSVEWCYF